jgi:hypothetical protein
MPSKDHTTKEPRRANRPTLIFDADFIQSADFQYFMAQFPDPIEAWAAWGVVTAIVGQARRSESFKADICPRRAVAISRLLGLPLEFLKRVIDAGCESTMLERDGDLIWSP